MAVSSQQNLRPSRPIVSKRFTDGSQAAFLGSESKLVKGALSFGSVCLELQLADALPRSDVGSQRSTNVNGSSAEYHADANWCGQWMEMREGDCLAVGRCWWKSKHREVWNKNGGDLFDILKQHHFKAANTFHAARARSWTWQQHRQDKQIRHRLDYLLVPKAAQWKCQVDCDSPVNFSGYRDHRPVGLLIPRR